jgi:hypothetical protein
MKWFRSRDSSVVIAIGYWLDERGVGDRVLARSSIFSTLSKPALGSTQPFIQWVPRAPSLGLKRQRREADHSSPTSVEDKKMWIYTSTLPYAFIAYQLLTHRGQFYLLPEMISSQWIFQKYSTLNCPYFFNMVSSKLAQAVTLLPCTRQR